MDSSFDPILVNEECSLKKGATWVVRGGWNSRWKMGPKEEEMRNRHENILLFEVLPSLAPVDIRQSEHPVAVNGKPVWRLPACDEDWPSR